MNPEIENRYTIREKVVHDFFGRKTLNLDICHRCPLQCLRCGRQTSFLNKGKKVPGRDLTIEEFDKISDHFDSISFCGQYSDPIHHPQFIDFLVMCKEKNVQTEIHTASNHKADEWYIDAWEANDHAKWIFAIDGLPHMSHKYRVNQDGIKLFDIMLKSKDYLVRKVVWQYIVFFYNEKYIAQAMSLARQSKLEFQLINSSRWVTENDYLRPTIRV